MVKNDIINHVALEHEITCVDAEKAVNSIFNTMSEALVDGDRIELRGFGSFCVRHYKSYFGRNPKTGEIVHVKQKKLPYFKIGKWFAIQLSPNLLTEHPTFKNNRKIHTTEEIQDKIKKPNHKHFHKKPVGRGSGA